MSINLKTLVVIVTFSVLQSCSEQSDIPPSQVITDDSDSGTPAPVIDNGGSNIFFNEDFESASLSNSFNSAWFGSFMSNPDFSLAMNNVATGLYAISYNYQKGETANNGYATQHFGDSTKTPVHTDELGTKFEEIYLQYKVYYSPGFDFSSGNNKQFTIGAEDGVDHNEACCNPWQAHYVTIAVGSDSHIFAEANNKKSTSGQWVGLNPNDSGYNNTNRFMIQTGKWYLVEVHIKLNESGQQNGIFEQWIDGVRVTYRDNILYRYPFDGVYGTSFAYGINFLVNSNYINNPATKDQAVYYDDIKLSTSYIGPT